MKKEEIIFLDFPHPGSSSTESIPDTSIWFSRIFEEELSEDSHKQRLGQASLKLLDEYSSKNKFIAVLDTISWEFSDMVSHKVEEFSLLIRRYLLNAKKRIEEGENKNEVFREISNEIKSNPHFNSIYHYFEWRGKGFSNVYNNPSLRGEFFRLLHRLPSHAVVSFDVITHKFVRRWVKDSIMLWAIDFKNFFFLFQKNTPNIGKKDRFHLIGCIMLCCSGKRPVQFITFDEKILNVANAVIDFLDHNKSLLSEQFSKLLIEETITA